MASVTFNNDFSKKPSRKQMADIEKASCKEIVFDEDCLEITPESLEKLKLWTEGKNRRKENVTLRLTPAVIKKAKSLGKGYTSVMASIIESIFSDEDELKRVTEKLNR